MERFQKRSKKTGLNLVSLMDIFTILVFFLLVNSSSVQQLPNSKDIKLPTSVAKKVPKETIIITVTAQAIIVQGVKIANVNEVLGSNETLIPELEKELTFQSGKVQFNQAPPVIDAANPAPPTGKSVTIMGDENLPYELVRKVLATCRQANYTNIAFAARQKAKGKV